MKAVLFDQLGGPEVMKLSNAPTPEIRPGKVLIKNHAVGINFADTLFRKGEYVMQPKFPDIPGLEASGIVEAVGAGVEGIQAGDRVAAEIPRLEVEILVQARQVPVKQGDQRIEPQPPQFFLFLNQSLTHGKRRPG